ncbi:transglycosylase domain-containing protein [Saccharothrix longispora]|uniref:transglycosylase domain-containing protein n=1 Tax=Saccharothrix longispora TaxID=33920 RepID=UPI0028FD6D39|nr:transglycosylase domain-containing protein [Saccharothrix longispora]MDU0287763.1 transglycosylase domain-containing protein [Saccharothrix longispora]
MTRLVGLCLVAGVLLAGVLFPVVGGAGLLLARAGDRVTGPVALPADVEPPLMTTLVDADGEPFAHLYDQYRVPTASDGISQAMKDAIVAVEDHRFYEHQGVDWVATARAALRNYASGGVVQGASTLTQQYVKNLLVHVVARDDPLRRERLRVRTPARKLREIRMAITLENTLSKDEILTRYLNTVPFGAGTYGVAAAAQAYFGTTPDLLTVPQAALLAALVNSPTALDPEQHPDAASQRRDLVIDLMARHGALVPEVAERAKREPLGVRSPVRPLPTGCVGADPGTGFFCSFVVDQLVAGGFDLERLKTGGYTVRTTLDRNASAAAERAVEAQVPSDTPGVANTMAVVKPGREEHRVLALVANRDHGVDAQRFQTMLDLPGGVANKFGAGSVYKIFTAAAALEQGYRVDSVIPSPASYTSRVFKGGAPGCPSTGEPDTRWYCLSNHDDGYPPRMTLRQALATSPNTAFVILEERVGLDAVVDVAHRLGMRRTLASNIAGEPPDPDSPRPGLRVDQAGFFTDRQNASFTLGPAPSSTLELANVAATIVGGGTWCEPTTLVAVLDRHGEPVGLPPSPCEQAVPEPLANALAVALSDDDDRGTAAAAARAHAWTRPAIGKTGTTEEYKSAAFLGATVDYAGAVQTFNDSPEPRAVCVGAGPPRLCGTGNLYGGTAPAHTWFDAMTEIHTGLPAAPLPPVAEGFRAKPGDR